MHSTLGFLNEKPLWWKKRFTLFKVLICVRNTILEMKNHNVWLWFLQRFISNLAIYWFVVVFIHSFRKQIIDSPGMGTRVEARNTAASALLHIGSISTGTCMALHLRTFKCEEFKRSNPIAALQNLTSLGDSLLYILNNVNNITADRNSRQQNLIWL